MRTTIVSTGPTFHSPTERPRWGPPRRTLSVGGQDPIAVLRGDHELVEELFTAFQNAPEVPAIKRSLVDRIIEAMTTHTAIEEEVFYPWARTVMNSDDLKMLDALEEHALIMWLLDELRELDPEHDRFDAKVRVLAELARHHIWEEEAGIFGDALDAASDRELRILGRALNAAKNCVLTKQNRLSRDRAPTFPRGLR